MGDHFEFIIQEQARERINIDRLLLAEQTLVLADILVTKGTLLNEEQRVALAGILHLIEALGDEIDRVRRR